ncbi:hypothetical protein JHK86_033463 [Glycine max]|nr:hypothetical protein JHK86_033463 [Glycine max]
MRSQSNQRSPSEMSCTSAAGVPTRYYKASKKIFFLFQFLEIKLSLKEDES